MALFAHAWNIREALKLGTVKMRQLSDLVGDLATVLVALTLAYAVAAWAMGWWLPTL
jgi:hypothetical protein